MDVFALAKHEYLQPPVSKHGRSNVQMQSNAQQSSTAICSSGNNQGTASGSAGQTTFSTGMFGNMNQSSSS